MIDCCSTCCLSGFKFDFLGFLETYCLFVTLLERCCLACLLLEWLGLGSWTGGSNVGLDNGYDCLSCSPSFASDYWRWDEVFDLLADLDWNLFALLVLDSLLLSTSIRMAAKSAVSLCWNSAAMEENWDSSSLFMHSTCSCLVVEDFPAPRDLGAWNFGWCGCSPLDCCPRGSTAGDSCLTEFWCRLCCSSICYFRSRNWSPPSFDLLFCCFTFVSRIGSILLLSD